MTPFHLLLLLGLAAVPQEPDKPPRPHRQDPQGEREKLEQLVKLPDDFVLFARVPEGGIRPRVARQAELWAVLYYKGGEASGDLYLARSTDEARTFAPAVRVNPTPGSVLALEGEPTGAIDLGPDGRAHVTWISSGDAPSVFYACEPAPGASELVVQEFGPMNGLSTPTAIGVEKSGQVLVFNVATGPASDDGAVPGQRIYMRKSADAKTFTPAAAIETERHEIKEVSEKSGISGHVDAVMGTIFIAYRSCYTLKPDDPSPIREMRLLSSEDHGLTFRSTMVDNWKQARDPRSSVLLFQDENTTVVAWDAGGDAFWAPIRRNLNRTNAPMEVKGGGSWRSHPAGAATEKEVLLAWIEQPMEEGKVKKDAPATLAWQVWQLDPRAPLGRGVAPAPPEKSTPAVFGRGQKGFTILY